MSLSIVTFKQIELALIKAFEKLNVSYLDVLDESATYSFSYKHEFIVEMQTLFKNLKSKGLTSLIVKPSKCNYCYPTGKAYSFFHPETNEFITKYVIFQESEKVYRVEECRNKPVPDGADGMPF